MSIWQVNVSRNRKQSRLVISNSCDKYDGSPDREETGLDPDLGSQDNSLNKEITFSKPATLTTRCVDILPNRAMNKFMHDVRIDRPISSVRSKPDKTRTYFS